MGGSTHCMQGRVVWVVHATRSVWVGREGSQPHGPHSIQPHQPPTNFRCKTTVSLAVDAHFEEARKSEPAEVTLARPHRVTQTQISIRVPLHYFQVGVWGGWACGQMRVCVCVCGGGTQAQVSLCVPPTLLPVVGTRAVLAHCVWEMGQCRGRARGCGTRC